MYVLNTLNLSPSSIVCYNSRYNGYYLNPNPKYQVLENLGNAILGQTSGSNFENPNYLIRIFQVTRVPSLI